MAQALFAAEPSLHIYAEFNNEVWDAGFPGVEACQFPLAWLSDPTGGSGYQGQIRFGLGYAALRMWKAFDDTFGASQVTALMSGWMGLPSVLDCFDYVDASLTFNPGGLTIKQIMINRLAANVTLPGAGYLIAAYDTPGSNTIKAHLTNGSAVMTNIQNWDNKSAAGAGWTVSDQSQGTGWSGTTVTIDSTTQVTTDTVFSGSTGDYWLSWNGDQLHGAYLVNGSTGSVPNSYWDNSIKNGAAFINYAIGLSMNYVRARVPNCPLCIYEWGVVVSGSGSYTSGDVTTWRNYVNYLNTSNAQVSFKYFWDNAIAPWNPNVANHYRAPGNYYGNTGFLFTFPISQQDVESARNIWYKTV